MPVTGPYRDEPDWEEIQRDRDEASFDEDAAIAAAEARYEARIYGD